MFETTGSYRGAFWLSAGLSLLSIVFVWLAGPTRRRRRSVALATETVREVATIEEVRVNPVGTGAARMPSQTAPTYQFASVTPVLGCRDYLRARSFYRDALGFRVLAETGAPPRSGSLERNGFVVYLDGWQGARSHLPRLWSLYVRVRGLEQLYADLVRLGVVVSMPPTRTPQGTLELEIVDPEGNVICFSEEAGTGERPGSYGTRS
jgi:catechol 2,3-dioxygenase-like lactoylglutathione lyase family enzyme